MRTVYEFSVKDRKGNEVSLREYANEVLLIVNTATKCGFTPQYEELEKLYERYHAQGFEILDFPCNQFGQQAPGTDESIHEFCKLTYGTEFPQFKKIKVNGDDAVAHVGAEALSLLTQIHHHLVGINALGIAGEVLNDRGLRELATRLDATVLNGLQVRTSCIDGSGITGRSAAYNETLCLFHICISFL